MKADEIVKKYIEEKEHSKNVSRLSLLFFEKIKPYFLRLENYNNKKDLDLLKYGAMLHDVGIFFEKAYGLSHNKAGAKYIIENKPDEIDEEDVFVLAALIRYHRKSLPNETKHKIYKKLDPKQKAKVNYLGSIIRLVDGFDFGHINLIENFDVEYDPKNNVLTLLFPWNIILNKPLIEAINEKKNFFESVFQTRLEIKGS